MIEIEVTEQEYYRLHELLLIGMMNKEDAGLRSEYGEAYDEFVDYSPVGARIGDQPEAIQKVWEDFLASEAEDRRES